MDIVKYWMPQFSEVFHMNGEKFVTLSQLPAYVTGFSENGQTESFVYGVIDENQPQTIRIGSVDVPAPLRIAPNSGEQYWCVDLASEFKAFVEVWTDDPIEIEWLDKGILHKTSEDTIMHANAILELSKVRT